MKCRGEYDDNLLFVKFNMTALSPYTLSLRGELTVVNLR